jgi:hypothetical protein
VSPKIFETFFPFKYHIFIFPARRARGRRIFFLKFFLKNSSKIPPGDAAAAASNQQQPAASSSQQQREIIQVYMYTQIFDKTCLLTL